MTRTFTPGEHGAWIESMHKTPSSAAMFLEDAAGRLLVVKANYKDYWSLPGGMVDKGESPLEAALREVKEEIGCTIAPESAVFIAAVYRFSTEFDNYQFIFKAPIDDASINGIVLQASEIDAYAFTTRQQVAERDKAYAPAIRYWAEDRMGYVEQAIDAV